jgi:para-nitrobenzyl esterase
VALDREDGDLEPEREDHMRRILGLALWLLVLGGPDVATGQRAVARYVRYSRGADTAYGILEGETIRELRGDLFAGAAPTGSRVALRDARLLAPVVPSKVIAVGLNYRSHLGGRPPAAYPGLFAKYPTSIVGPGADIVLPGDAANAHFEGELVVVIGKRASNVSREEAADYVFGVTAGNDISERDWQRNDLQWFRAKASDTFGPIGPAVATGLDYDDLLLQTRVNGKVVQSERTRDLIFDVATIVSYVSRYVTLLPGDVIFTGTPQTTSALQPGDVVEVEVEGVGTLRNQVVRRPGPRAQADGETLEGTLFGGPTEAVFRGIPYAAPPVGDLRWKPPEPHRAREGIRSAREFGPSCPQSNRLVFFNRGIATVFGTQAQVPDPPLNIGEDCLTLNVWTANWGRTAGGGSGQPVMVWIHGGSNLSGEGSASLYWGDKLARRGVVVVTINYRLGALGFLAHPALTAESPRRASGNYGLLDQLAALQWVKRNIAGFGGDPARVTVFGESAGAIDLTALMTSPLAKGLFHRAIAQSGVAIGPLGALLPLARAEAAGAGLAKALGVDTAANVTDALRRTPLRDLLAAADRLILAGRLPVSPIVDGWVLPDLPGRAFDAGRQLGVPLLVGSNAREMSSLPYYLPRFDRTVSAYRRYLDSTFGTTASRIAELYPAAADAEVERQLTGLVTDYFFTCPARLTARSMAAASAPAYLYQFTRVLPRGEKLGAYHGAELGYVFDTQPSWLPKDAVDDSLTAVMGAYWTAFAKSGLPEVEGLPRWAPYSAGSDQYLELGGRVAPASGLKREACDLMERGGSALGTRPLGTRRPAAE